MKTRQYINLRIVLGLLIWSSVVASPQQSSSPLPSSALKFGAFVATFDPGGTFKLQGQGWPALNGNWKTNGNVIELTMSGGPGGCDGVGRYEFHVDEKTANRVSFKLVSDDCAVRRIIVDGSNWLPASEARVIPPRRIKLKSGARLSASTIPKNSDSNWPSFRGQQASGVAEKQNLPARPARPGSPSGSGPARGRAAAPRTRPRSARPAGPAPPAAPVSSSRGSLSNTHRVPTGTPSRVTNGWAM